MFTFTGIHIIIHTDGEETQYWIIWITAKCGMLYVFFFACIHVQNKNLLVVLNIGNASTASYASMCTRRTPIPTIVEAWKDRRENYYNLKHNFELLK